jgi:hypothetical protein
MTLFGGQKIQMGSNEVKQKDIAMVEKRRTPRSGKNLEKINTVVIKVMCLKEDTQSWHINL